MEKIILNEQNINKLTHMVFAYAPKLVFALLTLLIGFWISKRIASTLLNLLNLNKADPSLAKWLTSFLSITLKVLIIISVASMIGVETTSFIALLGAAGLAVGLALQGSLANFAGGLLILFFKPFVVGDFISAQGEDGYVDAIDIFCTYIRTFDNRTVILPNGSLAGEKIINLTKLDKRRVDLKIGISYKNDYKIAAQALINMALKDPMVLTEPVPFVGVNSYGDNSINLDFRVWCHTNNYWEVYYSLNNNIKITLDQAQISIPFPQRDVHIYN